MTIAEAIPDAVTFTHSLGTICLIGAVIGCFFTLAACACVLSFPVAESERLAVPPPVTILKPLHDAEPGLPARLTAFCRQDYEAPVQILCGAHDQTSPVAAVVHAMESELPDDSIELVLDPRHHGVNRKVSNLINIMSSVRHDTLVMSDSDIVVDPNYLSELMARLAAPGVGAVTCLYYGIGGNGLWTQLSALAINGTFLPHAVAAVSLGLAKPCCGATIAIRRSMLDRIGGFTALADTLADDHAIGVGVRAQGYDVVTAPFLVGHCCFENNLRELIRQQIRVARTINCIDPLAYAGTIITHPWPLALLALFSGTPAAVMVTAAVLMGRAMLCRCVEWRFNLPRQNYWLIPVQDLIAFGVYLASFFGATVHWRGADYRVNADGTLLEGHDLRGS
ncbi:MAG: bacteriohopanetetrol glucosamine biosynthesis glycosyltransferase HpnI [Hyphomicrobiales bacterium]|nr:bacteriohopanetetrol glucosamine biosynthesis glycosyltransferase HpnI [Hyphomicrobiales bacterium]